VLNYKPIIIGVSGFLILISSFAFGIKRNKTQKPDLNQATNPQTIIITSDFKDGGLISSIYSCDGQDINPPLEFTNLPPQTKSLAVIVSDPDAPGGTFYHWLIFNLNPASRQIKKGQIFKQAITLPNDFGQAKYNGPCPPKGQKHHYFFKLYAMPQILDTKQIKTKQDLINAIQAFSLGYGQIVGTYQR